VDLRRIIDVRVYTALKDVLERVPVRTLGQSSAGSRMRRTLYRSGSVCLPLSIRVKWMSRKVGLWDSRGRQRARVAGRRAGGEQH
jgi:hypothetical protein